MDPGAVRTADPVALHRLDGVRPLQEIEIVDEAAGEFLEVSQEGGKLRFDKEEWPHVRDAIEKMFKLCRNYD